MVLSKIALLVLSKSILKTLSVEEYFKLYQLLEVIRQTILNGKKISVQPAHSCTCTNDRIFITINHVTIVHITK